MRPSYPPALAASGPALYGSPGGERMSDPVVTQSAHSLVVGADQLLHAPGRLGPDRVKEIVDGVVSALQAEEDPARALEVAPRVAPDVEAPVEDVAALSDSRRAVLGVIRGLRRPPAWHPSDDRCVAAELRVRPGGAWTVQGDVVTVLPR
jgi:hypothetical protein